jgi:hypothetical protein
MTKLTKLIVIPGECRETRKPTRIRRDSEVRPEPAGFRKYLKKPEGILKYSVFRAIHSFYELKGKTKST